MKCLFNIQESQSESKRDEFHIKIPEQMLLQTMLFSMSNYLESHVRRDYRRVIEAVQCRFLHLLNESFIYLVQNHNSHVLQKTQKKDDAVLNRCESSVLIVEYHKCTRIDKIKSPYTNQILIQ